MLGQLVEFAVGAGLEAGRLSMLKEQCVGPAVEIARAQGWVSPGRLRARMGLSLRDARFVLIVACQRGHLYEAVNGRCYVADSAAPVPGPVSDAPLFAPLPDEPPPAPTPASSKRKSNWPLVVCAWAVVAIGGVAWGVTTLDRPRVNAYRPSPDTDIGRVLSSPSTGPGSVAVQGSVEHERQEARLSAALDAAPPSVPQAAHEARKHPRHRDYVKKPR